jgi:hypothetical protein
MPDAGMPKDDGKGPGKGDGGMKMPPP